MRKQRPIRWTLERLAFSGARALLAGRSRASIARTAHVAGRIAVTLARSRHQLACRQVARVYPQLDASTCECIAREAFNTAAESALDLLRIARLSPEQLRAEIHVEGWEHLDRAIARGSGVIVLSAHYANWEWVALQQSLRDAPMTLVYRPLDNPHLNRFVADTRTRFGNRLASKRDGIRPLLKALQRGETLGIVADQAAGHSGIRVPFLGLDSSTTQTPAWLAAKTGCALVPAYCRPAADGQYRVVYEAPIPVPAVEPDRLYRDVTQSINQRIESWIHEAPGRWFWMHRRWRLPQEWETP